MSALPSSRRYCTMNFCLLFRKFGTRASEERPWKVMVTEMDDPEEMTPLVGFTV